MYIWLSDSLNVVRNLPRQIDSQKPPLPYSLNLDSLVSLTFWNRQQKSLSVTASLSYDLFEVPWLWKDLNQGFKVDVIFLYITEFGMICRSVELLIHGALRQNKVLGRTEVAAYVLLWWYAGPGPGCGDGLLPADYDTGIPRLSWCSGFPAAFLPGCRGRSSNALPPPHDNRGGP